jgi:hypothetical protein
MKSNNKNMQQKNMLSSYMQMAKHRHDSLNTFGTTVSKVNIPNSPSISTINEIMRINNIPDRENSIRF